LYRKILEKIGEDGENSMRDTTSASVIKIMKYEQLKKKINLLMEKIGLLYMQIWTSLLDETPSISFLNLKSVDMKRTCDIGFLLLQYEKEVRENWKNMKNVYVNTKDSRTYAHFLHVVCNDEEESMKILQ
jgi:hypothetical protein